MVVGNKIFWNDRGCGVSWPSAAFGRPPHWKRAHAAEWLPMMTRKFTTKPPISNISGRGPLIIGHRCWAGHPQMQGNVLQTLGPFFHDSQDPAHPAFCLLERHCQNRTPSEGSLASELAWHRGINIWRTAGFQIVVPISGPLLCLETRRNILNSWKDHCGHAWCHWWPSSHKESH